MFYFSLITTRAVYDGQDIEYFMEKLGGRIKSHDHEIERMCNYHYQGFIDSIRELQQVSGDATKLKVLNLFKFLINLFMNDSDIELKIYFVNWARLFVSNVIYQHQFQLHIIRKRQ